MHLSLSQSFSSNTVVMVFGVFDLLHPGHLSFLQQAKNYGNTLIVVVTRDAIVEKLKKRLPYHSELVRCNELKKVPGIFFVVLGDEILGTYSVIKEYKPDYICLGYDQQGLGNDLHRRIETGELPFIECVYLEPYEPEKYHTSLIRKAYGF